MDDNKCMQGIKEDQRLLGLFVCCCCWVVVVCLFVVVLGVGWGGVGGGGGLIIPTAIAILKFIEL